MAILTSLFRKIIEINAGKVELGVDVFGEFYLLIESVAYYDEMIIPNGVQKMKVGSLSGQDYFLFDNSEGGVIRIREKAEFEKEQNEFKEMYKDIIEAKKKEGG